MIDNFYAYIKRLFTYFCLSQSQKLEVHFVLDIYIYIAFCTYLGRSFIAYPFLCNILVTEWKNTDYILLLFLFYLNFVHFWYNELYCEVMKIPLQLLQYIIAINWLKNSSQNPNESKQRIQ